MKTEAQIYAETFESVRNLSKFYLSQLTGIDVHKSIEFNGKKFNSPYWIAAHLTWTEHSLLIEALGAELMNIPWLEKFSIGTEPPGDANLPAFEEILETMEQVHSSAMEKVNSLTDEQLDEPNVHNITFGGVNSKRAIIKHCIRHEPMHIGQISWYLKINDVEMP
jgi:uncharacterized damage-inducible protein DinB